MPARSATRDPAVDAYVRRHKGAVGASVGMLVALFRKTVPGASEKFHHGVPWFFVHGRPVCYVAAQRGYVNLGFRYGATLDDPDELLEGTGESMRHVKVRAPEAVSRSKLARLLKQAAKRAPGP